MKIGVFHLFQEICEFQKLLNHLNKKIATPVCFYIMLNTTYTLSGLIFLFKNYDYNTHPIKIFSLNVGNIILWLTISLFPFFQVSVFVIQNDFIKQLLLFLLILI